MTEGIFIALATAAAHGLVMWGVMSTKLEWIRTDLDDHEERLDYLERRRYATPAK